MVPRGPICQAFHIPLDVKRPTCKGCTGHCLSLTARKEKQCPLSGDATSHSTASARLLACRAGALGDIRLILDRPVHFPQHSSSWTPSTTSSRCVLVCWFAAACANHTLALQNDKSGIGSAINNAGGGGADGEKKEDMLDKGVDWVQQVRCAGGELLLSPKLTLLNPVLQNVMNQGVQDNETATEQAKDNMIAETIRNQYKERTGSDFPIQDK